jgi:hypothetical protein
MSIKVNDIIKINVNRKLIEKGVKHAEKSWPYTYNRMGKGDIYARVRNIVKGVIAQEALSCVFSELNIPYETEERERWFEVNHCDFQILTSKKDLKLKVDIKSFWISQNDRRQYEQIQKEGAKYFLDCHALVPKDQLEGREMEDDDVYIFAFAVGTEIKKASFDQLNFQSSFEWLIHCMKKYEFCRPERYLKEYGDTPLGTIKVISSSQDANCEFVLGGTRSRREFYQEKITLNSNGIGKTKGEFFQLFFIRPADKNWVPSNKIIIKSEDGNTDNIPPIYGYENKNRERNGWADIWVYAEEIYYVGFATKKYLKNNAKILPRYSKVKQFETKTDNYGILVKHLLPLSNLKL